MRRLISCFIFGVWIWYGSS